MNVALSRWSFFLHCKRETVVVFIVFVFSFFTLLCETFYFISAYCISYRRKCRRSTKSYKTFNINSMLNAVTTAKMTIDWWKRSRIRKNSSECWWKWENERQQSPNWQYHLMKMTVQYAIFHMYWEKKNKVLEKVMFPRLRPCPV
jgi:hypothetical protein